MTTLTWQQKYFNRPALTLLLLGFVAGIPLALIFGTLSLWLREAGIDKKTVTMFGWAALGFSFKFVWAPLIDTLALPFLSKRRAWLLVAQLSIIGAILLMAFTDPMTGMVGVMALGAVWLGFSSATQDIVIDAYRIEIAPPSMQAHLGAMYVAGYRVGMLASGAGALILAERLGSSSELYSFEAWRMTYIAMAALMLVGVATTLLMKEPNHHIKKTVQQGYGGLVLTFIMAVLSLIGVFILMKTDGEYSVLVGFLLEVSRFITAAGVGVLVAFILAMIGVSDKKLVMDLWISPIIDFFNKYGKPALLILALIGFYRVSDIVMGIIANVYYQDLGFSKTQIGAVSKGFGLVMTIVGGFAGGVMVQHISLMRAMMVGALASALTNLIFIALSSMPSLPMLYLVISADNFAAGLASAVFLAFLSALTSIRFTAVQYALFSSLMTLFPKLLGGYSGTIVENTSYPVFFIITFVMGLPVLYLIYLVSKRVDLVLHDDLKP